MSNKIGGIDQRAAPVAASTPAPRVRDAATEGPRTGSTGRGDVVITETARTLAELETKLAGLPAINDSRVAAVRRAIEEGRYQVDPQRIADKLMRMERDLVAVSDKTK
jgi:negative regulator of flagellin synthesis FlgM